MCGIVGIINFDNKRIDKQSSSSIKKTLSSMQNSIKHRGPDGKGSFFYKNTGIAMRRLSIIDIKGGDQPLFNENKTIAIVGNGEIYNYLELQKELTQKGHILRTKSDIETITHAYEEWGLSCFSKFRGMFAISMIDIKNNKVIIARDKMGEKPLYFTQINNSYYFGSELKSLINIPKFDKTINFSAIDLFFHYYYIPEPQTPFLYVKKVKSGSYLEIDLETADINEVIYWDPTKIKTNIKGDPTKLIRKEFKKACEFSLRADVPIGIALSGGIDSGSILAVSAPKYKKRMKAFSIGYEGFQYSDEREMAKKLAKEFNVDFIEKEIKTKSVISHFPRLVWDTDDPIADIAAHSIYEVNKLARANGIKVLLGGNGGDEIFWGYPSTIDALNKSLKKQSFVESITGGKKIRYNNPDPKSVGLFIERLYSNKFKNSLTSNYLSVIKNVNLKDKDLVINATLENLRNLWLKSNVITLGDRMSMAASVELRSPFLDYKLIELALSSKKNLSSFKDGQKVYFKKAMKGILPDEVLNRPKRGFTPPVATWIQGMLKKYGPLIKNGFLVKENIIDKTKINLISNLINEIPSYTAYQLLVMEIWGRLYVYNEKMFK